MPWLLGDYISGVYSFRATSWDEGTWLFQLGAGLSLLCYGSCGLEDWGKLCPVTHMGRAPTASMCCVGWQEFVVELMESVSALLSYASSNSSLRD